MDLRPQSATFGVAVSTSAELHATMFSQKADGVYPYLAASEDFVPSTNQLRLMINPLCRWSDGKPIVAKDFIASARSLYLNGNSSVPGLGFIRNGQEVLAGELPFSSLGITEISTNVVGYDLAATPEMARLILSLPNYAPLPSHKINEGDDYWSNPEKQVFSGPFRVTAVTPEGITLNKNEFFCLDSPPLVETAQILFGRSVEKDADLLIRRRVDLLGNLNARQRVHFRRHGPPTDYRLEDSQTAAIAWLALNPNELSLVDSRVRKAIRLAYDPTLIDTGNIGILRNSADTLTYRYPGYEPPAFPWSSVPYESAVATAQKLMREAGYSKDNPLRLTLSAAPLNEYKSVGALFQSMFAPIFIEVEVLNDSVEEYLARTAEPNGDFGMQIFYWFADFPDPANFLEAIISNEFHSAGVGEELHSMLYQALNSSHMERLALAAQAEKILADDGYILPIGVPVRTWLVRQSVEFDNSVIPTIRDLSAYECRGTAMK